MKTRIALALLLITASALARTPQEQARIEYLITSLGKLPGAVFIRNGSNYNASDAQDHLRQKLRFAGERVRTAEQFIKYCASKSSMTHQPYQIRFGDGKVQNTADYFAAELREYDSSQRQ